MMAQRQTAACLPCQLGAAPLADSMHHLTLKNLLELRKSKATASATMTEQRTDSG